MSGSQKQGMGASVGVRKISSDGDTMQEEGEFDDGPGRMAWIIFWAMIVLSLFGLWKVISLVTALI